ncbi:hypothetical protein C8Q78DRAFT_312111 [Trametes maxima]|nr:hypothetical protein C8Q78DRAFT_312111 [Trametes maxima]
MLSSTTLRQVLPRNRIRLQVYVRPEASSFGTHTQFVAWEAWAAWCPARGLRYIDRNR